MSINLRSESPINGRSRSERDVAAVFAHTHRVSGSPPFRSNLLHVTLGVDTL